MLSIGALATALFMLLVASGAGTASAQEEGATATTTAATTITATEATLNGTVNANGYTVSGCQFLYGPTTKYGSDVACTTLPGTGTTDVSAVVSGLSPGAPYHFELEIVYANAAGAAVPVDGGDESFMTITPSASIAAASSVSQTAATLNGAANPEGATISSCEFYWGITVNGATSFNNTTSCAQTVGSGTSEVPVSASLTGLSSRSTYTFYLEVQYNCEESPCGVGSAEMSFTTLPNAPTVVTEAGSEVSQTAATLNGTVNPNGATISNCQFQWGTTAKYGNTTGCAQTIGSGTSPVAASADLTGLSANTTYHYRILATNPGGTTYGTDQTFSTGAIPFPGVSTSPASAVSQTGATLNGTVNPNGATISNCQFQWGTNTNYGNTTVCGQTVGSGTSLVAVSANLTGLSPNTTYHYRILATNPGGTSYGTDQTFSTQPGSTVSGSGTGQTVTTQSGPPSPVITGAPTVTGPNGAAFSGGVNPDGLATTAYFQYGIPQSAQGPEGSGPTFTQFTPVQTVGSDFSSHGVSASASGLVPNELYDVQLVATNSAGTTYGPVETFETAADAAPPAPVLGKQVNVALVSGAVWIKPPPGESLGAAGDNAALSKGTGFVPLTEARQIPTGSEIDALHGSLKMVSNTGQVGKTQTATLAGGVFKVTQARTGITKGLTNFNLVESAFQGAPTYATCNANYKAGDATAASLSTKTLQLLKVSGHGKFRTTGRYSSATVRGTIYTVADRCDGTLTHVIRDTVLVDDFARHKTILLHAGQSYLAKKP